MDRLVEDQDPPNEVNDDHYGRPRPDSCGNPSIYNGLTATTSTDDPTQSPEDTEGRPTNSGFKDQHVPTQDEEDDGLVRLQDEGVAVLDDSRCQFQRYPVRTVAQAPNERRGKPTSLVALETCSSSSGTSTVIDNCTTTADVGHGCVVEMCRLFSKQ